MPNACRKTPGLKSLQKAINYNIVHIFNYYEIAGDQWIAILRACYSKYTLKRLYFKKNIIDILKKLIFTAF